MPQTVKTVVAVYGSLRKGMANHHVIEAHQGTFIKEAVVKGYKMYDRNGDRSYPFILAGGGSPEDEITVEIYRLGPKGLAKVDAVEGFSSARPTAGKYIRKTVLATDGTSVQIYVWNKALSAEDVMIPSGNWAGYMGRPAAPEAGETTTSSTEEGSEEAAGTVDDLENNLDNDTLIETIADNLDDQHFGNFTEDAKKEMVADFLDALSRAANVKLETEDGEVIININ